VLAGPYDISKFRLRETNNNTLNVCFVGNPCSVTMEMYDNYGNRITIGTIFGPNDFDAFLIGPYELAERPWTDVSGISNIGNGQYLLTYYLIRDGHYKMFLRIEAISVYDFPFEIIAFSNNPNAPTSNVVGFPITEIRAGEVKNYTLLVKDELGNLAY